MVLTRPSKGHIVCSEHEADARLRRPQQILSPLLQGRRAREREHRVLAHLNHSERLGPNDLGSHFLIAAAS